MEYYVYMMTNTYGTTLYTGVTNDLVRRVYEHRMGTNEGFTKRYNAHRLVYFESTNDSMTAIEREKQIKGWSRRKKDALVNGFNPEWRDLWEDIVG